MPTLSAAANHDRTPMPVVKHDQVHRRRQHPRVACDGGVEVAEQHGRHGRAVHDPRAPAGQHLGLLLPPPVPGDADRVPGEGAAIVGVTPPMLAARCFTAVTPSCRVASATTGPAGGGHTDAMKTWMKWTIAAVVVVVVSRLVAGPFIYINFIKEDEAGSLESGCAATPTSAAEATTGGSAFTSTGGGSRDRRRPPSRARGRSGRAARPATASSRCCSARTRRPSAARRDVTGQLTVDGGQVTAADFEVDMTTLTSPESRRDSAVQRTDHGHRRRSRRRRSRSRPRPSCRPTRRRQRDARRTGDLTLRGVTKPVTLDVDGRRLRRHASTSSPPPTSCSPTSRSPTRARPASPPRTTACSRSSSR